MSDTTIHPATADDVLFVARRLRFSDARELETASGRGAVAAVLDSVQASEQAFTGHIDGEPAVVFGVSSQGAVWMVCTDAIKRAPYGVLDLSRAVVAWFLQRYGRLHNQADTRNTTHLRWLKLLGCTFDDIVEVNGVRFQRFHFDRKEQPWSAQSSPRSG